MKTIGNFLALKLVFSISLKYEYEDEYRISISNLFDEILLFSRLSLS